MLALTFDDGPDPVWTDRVLAELERRGAVATFFLDASRALAAPRQVAAIGAGGHEVGFHCWAHRRHSELSESEVREDAARGLAALDSLGQRPTAWRAPWGVETDATRAVASAHGLELHGWNRDSHDWRGDTWAEMEASIEAEGGLDESAVVLMHDGIGPGARRRDCAETVRLTRALLEGVARQGLATATVSEARRSAGRAPVAGATAP